MTTLSPEGRRVLRVVGGVVVAVAVVSIVYGVSSGMLGGPSPGDPDFSQQVDAKGRDFLIFAMGGMVLLGIGAFLLRLGFMKAAAELVATETAGAVQHSSAALGRGVGRGLKESGWSATGRDVIKVKCRGCGFLESEDAKFCSQCAAAL